MVDYLIHKDLAVRQKCGFSALGTNPHSLDKDSAVRSECRLRETKVRQARKCSLS